MVKKWFWMAALLFIFAGMNTRLFAKVELSDRRMSKEVLKNPLDADPLNVGNETPPGHLISMDGKKKDFQELLLGKHTVLVFYQGGWSPACNAQMDQLASLAPQLVEKGYQVIAVSPDLPAKLQESFHQHQLNYSLFSDDSMKVTQRFGLAYRVENDYLKKNRIPLKEFTGNSREILTIPAVYVIDPNGIIQFLYFNPDPQVRIAPEKLLKAAGHLAAGNKAN